MGTAGCGYIDANDSACLNGYTYCDTVYPATETFTVDQIKVNSSIVGTNFRIGYGSLSGTTFTPEHYVTLGSLSIGLNTFNAPTDFTAFEIPAGKYIYFYASTSEGRPTRTTTPSPLGYGGVYGDKMDETSFEVTLYTTRALEVKFSGSAAGWSIADIDDQDPSNVDDVDDQSLSDIDEIDEI